VHFDWTISVGNVLTGIILLVGFITAHVQNIRKIESIEAKVSIMFEWFQRQVIYRP